MEDREKITTIGHHIDRTKDLKFKNSKIKKKIILLIEDIFTTGKSFLQLAKK
jgi:orotate phosphoribosyltransferase